MLNTSCLDGGNENKANDSNHKKKNKNKNDLTINQYSINKFCHTSHYDGIIFLLLNK